VVERCDRRGVGFGRELWAMGVLMIMMMIPYTCNNLFVFVFCRLEICELKACLYFVVDRVELSGALDAKYGEMFMVIGVRRIVSQGSRFAPPRLNNFVASSSLL
jgi:hypothetical protein